MERNIYNPMQNKDLPPKIVQNKEYYDESIHERKEVIPEKYIINTQNLTCSCKDWTETKYIYDKNDPRRLCKHIIKKFEYRKNINGFSNGDCLILSQKLLPFGYWF